MPRVLVTTTSFQDTPGRHHELLLETGWELVRARGPLDEAAMLALVGEVDAMICGDDALTRRVLAAAQPRLKVISKYGIGVDKIDVAAATELGIPVLFTPGVNHTTVAEHAFLLMLSLAKHLADEVAYTRAGEWKRLTGHELLGKTLAIVGLGRIGKEVAKRGRAFGMPLLAYDKYWDGAFAAEYGVERVTQLEELWPRADVITLHTNLSEETRGLISTEVLAQLRPDCYLINTARGELVDSAAVAQALESGQLGGYGTDVLDEEPPRPDHPLLKAPRCVVTPHIGSRTHESVQRQATMAVQNLILALDGKEPLAKVNEVPIAS